MFEGTEWASARQVEHELRKRVEKRAPLVHRAIAKDAAGRSAYVFIVNRNDRRVLLECGHSTKRHWSAPGRYRCVACLASVIYGPYRCTAHDDCREHPALGAACWNDRPGTRPTVADAIAATLRKL